MFEGTFELGADLCVEGLVFELCAEGDELAPLFSCGQHAGEEGFAICEAAIAVEQDVADGVAEGLVGATELHEGALGGDAIEGLGIGGRRAWRAAAGEQRKGSGDVRADGVDGADREPLGPVEDVPAEDGVAAEGGEGEGAGFGVEGVCGSRFLPELSVDWRRFGAA